MFFPAILIVALFVNAAASACAQTLDKASVARNFVQWLDTEIWPQARSLGVSRGTFDKAFSAVGLDWDLPDLVPPGTRPTTPREQHQAEFRSPARYFSEKTIGAVIAGGRSRIERRGRLLSALEERTGVPGRIIVAIWGRESGFGKAALPKDAIAVLATKAYMSTRKDMFEEELLAALVMLERGTPRSVMKSSWAGALGQPQFMPTSFLKYSTDGDGDGAIDIWNSEADTLASIARYLADKGWVKGRDWGFEVVVPESVGCMLEGPDQGMPISKWESMGMTRVSGRPFPRHELSEVGFLMMPAGRLGPAFLVTPNFYALKEYNESDLYALFIGHAADRIEFGGGPFTAPWRRTDSMLRSDIALLQRHLESLGHDVGGADGLPGYKTRRSIGRWEQAQGKNATCFPSSDLIAAAKAQ